MKNKRQQQAFSPSCRTGPRPLVTLGGFEMKFNRMKQITLNDSQLQQQARHGSTLLVVIALLAMLSLLGVV
ncbi:MAG TPA: hypothetical protein DCM07_06665, partial [Planctomycetaceae bacterium]|nr:hypothetical protein [Planctomycetaceae bacterium]